MSSEKETTDSSTAEDIENIFSKLTIKSTKENLFDNEFYYSKILSFCGWKNMPEDMYSSTEEILDCLSNQELILDIDPLTISILKNAMTLPKEFSVQPYKKTMPPENKPSLFVMIISLFLDEIKKSSPSSTPKDANIDNLLLHLNKFNIITPRNPIKKMISAMNSGESWSVMAFQPIKNGPIYLDRVQSYSSNAGTIGMLFEKSMIIPSKESYHRVYAITEGNLIVDNDNMKILMSGEVDCIDNETLLPVELKSKPAWAHTDESRLFDNWFQSKLAGISTIVTGGFTCERGNRNGPVTFSKRNIQYQSIEQYATKVSRTMKKQLFQQLHDVFNQIKQRLQGMKEGVVIKVDGTGGYDELSMKEKEGISESPFPITVKILRNIAEACILFHSP